MTIDQVIAEVESIFPQYVDAGLIDRIAISSNIISALKGFGNNIMVKSESFIPITGGKGRLPDDFWHLIVAIKTEPIDYRVVEGSHETLLDSYFYRQRTEERNIWNYTLDEYVPEDTTTIREEFVFKKSKAEFRYKPVSPLKLVKAFKRNKCAKNSPYKSSDFAKNSPYEINILNQHLQTNFSKGNIYMQYNALPTNDEGEVIIPETQHDELKRYILLMAQKEVLHRVWMANDDMSVGNKLQYIIQEERNAKDLAYTETKMESLRGWKKSYIQRKRAQTQAYENLLPRI